MWNLEGMRVWGNYHGADVSGVVYRSRVEYGGGVSHHLTVDEGFSTCGGRIFREAGESIIFSHSAIERVADVNSAA